MNLSYQPYRHLRRNFTLLLIDYVLFGVAWGLISPSAFIPDFFSQFTSDQRIIGFAGGLWTLAWLTPQLAFAQVVNRSVKRKKYLLPAMITRPAMLIIGALVMNVAPTNVSSIMIPFFILYTIFFVFDGFSGLAWSDLLGSSLTPKARGVLFGLGQFLSAIGAIVGREVLRYFLRPNGLPFPQNYASIFLISGVMFVIAGIALNLTKEEERESPIKPGPTLNEYLPYLGKVLRGDNQFRRFIVTRLLFDFSTLALPFYVVLGSSVLKLDSQTIVGDSLLISQFGNIGASIMIGWLSQRSGSKKVIQLAGLAKIAMPLFALWSISAGQPALYGSFFMLGVINAVTAPGYFDWVITHAPEDSRPIYMGLTNTISALGNVAPFLGGFILNLTGSFPLLFWLSATMGVAGMLTSIRMAEPRELKAAALLEAQKAAELAPLLSEVHP